MITYSEKDDEIYNKQPRTSYLNFLDSGLISAGRSWMHKKRFLSHFELIFVTQGQLHLRMNTMNIDLGKDEALVIPPYKTLSGSRESTGSVAFFWADFQTDSDQVFRSSSVSIPVSDPARLAELMGLLCSLALNATAGTQVRDSAMLLVIEQLRMSACISNHTVAEAVTACIDGSAHEPLTAESIARKLSYNKDYLCRIVKQAYGMTMKDYIAKRRLALAKRLLSTSCYSIGEISAMLGYTDSNLFTKYFRYHEGVSPSVYRRTTGG